MDEVSGYLDETPTVSSEEQNKFERKYRYFILEPAILLLFYAWNVSSAVFTNQVVYQACTVTFQHNETLCAQLGTENETQPEIEELEREVQPYAATILMAKSLIESIIPALCSMFIGPWSDKYGRKPVLMSTFIGSFFTYTLVAVICFLSSQYEVDPWYYILAYIPAALSGGNCALITGVFCYITDVTSEQNRAVKMGVLEAAIFGGLLFGILSSSYILRWTNAITVFAIASGAIFLGILYIIFYIEESIKPDELDNSTNKLREIFRFELVGDLFYTCFKRRPNFDRMIIWLVIAALGASIFALEGSGTVYFLFLRERFGWTVKEYSFYDATAIVFMIIGNLVAIYGVKKLFNLSESVLAAIGFCSYAIASAIHAIAYEPWHLYLGIGVSMMKGIAGPMGRAVISNTAPPSDIGKIFSLTTSIESLTPLASAPIYTYVYKQTMSWYPGAFNLISATVFFFCLCLMLLARVFQGMYQATTYTSIN